MKTVVVLHDRVPPDARADNLDTIGQADMVAGALAELGYRPVRLELDLDLKGAADRLRAAKPDLVFNLVETIEGDDRLIHVGCALLDHLGLPYTGAQTAAQLTTSHKPTAKTILMDAGLPTAPWAMADRVPRFPGPYIVKGAALPGSLGIEDSSVVTDAAEVPRIAADRRGRLGGDWFVERFIDGREFNVGMLEGADGPECLPVSEMRFVDFPEGKPRILSYDSKWAEQSFDYHHTPRHFDHAPEDGALLERLRELALACWHRFGLAGYGRVDFRVDRQGRPWILDVNANPCLNPEAGFVSTAAEAGITEIDIVRRIVAARLRPPPALPPRRRKGTPVPELAITWRDQAHAADIAKVRDIVAATGFFNAEEIDVAVELVEERLAKGPPSLYEFMFAEAGDRLLGYACYGRVPMTAASYDLYYIAVAPDQQGTGLGRVLLDRSEKAMRALGARHVYIDTASRGQYETTRAFYLANGYAVVAEYEDFYAPGDGKMVLRKALED
ncbi:MAG: GNAT family N-acetyltransferase [Alphaproteobacteria bacterium]|nr:GNAT family N-acetyltransferase [Alphaproteobacteria bacterium]